ncbi:MAG: signal recognition particle-docking protein FtsY [Oscillospiraceae bacterium]
MGFFKKVSQGLKKTRESITQQFDNLSKHFSKIDEDLLEELEEILIMSDVGVETSMLICENVRKTAKETKSYNTDNLKNIINQVIEEIMTPDTPIEMSDGLTVFLIIGVNGVGKTTTIGKLAAKYKNDGKKVVLAAADTFRAAAIEQLDLWAKRGGVDIIKHHHGSDPAAVVFDSIKSAQSKKADILIIDTAGRLHNKKNLMEELSKINRIIKKEAQDSVVQTFLILDATTGQNAVNQAKQFSEVTDINGLVLTKLDGTAKGGIVISIKNELNIPVRFIGVGEAIDDLQDFNPKDYVNALFEKEV